MNIIRRIVLTLSIYRECNRAGNYEYWTRKPIGRVGLRTAWRAAKEIA